MVRGSFIGHSCAVGQAMSLILASVVVSATGASMALMYASSERDLLAQEDAARARLLENDADKVMKFILNAAISDNKLVALQLDHSRGDRGVFESALREREYGSSVTESDTLDTSDAQENATATAWWASGVVRENASTAKEAGEDAACGSVQCQGVGGAGPVSSGPAGSDEASREVQRWDYNPHFREWGYRLDVNPVAYGVDRLDLSNVRVAYIGELPPETAKAGEEATDDVLLESGASEEVEERTEAEDGDGSDPASVVGDVDPSSLGVDAPEPELDSEYVDPGDEPDEAGETSDVDTDVGPDGLDPYVEDSGRRINQWEADILVKAGFDFIPRHHATTEANSERAVEESEAAAGSQATDETDAEAQAWQDAAGTGTSVGAGKVVHDEEDVSVDAENDVTGEESDVRDGDVFQDTHEQLTQLFTADELDHYQVIVVGSDVNMSVLNDDTFQDELAWWLQAGGILLVMPSWNTDYSFLDTRMLVNDIEATKVSSYEGRSCDDDQRLMRGVDSYCIHGEEWSVPTDTSLGSSRLLRNEDYRFDFTGWGPRQTWSMYPDVEKGFETVMKYQGEPAFLFSKASYTAKGDPNTLRLPYDNGRIILSGYSLGLLPDADAVHLMKSLMLHRSIPIYKTVFGFEMPMYQDAATAFRLMQVKDPIVGDVPMQLRLAVWHDIEGERILRVPELAPKLIDPAGGVQTASNLAQQAASDAQKDPGSVSPK